MKIRKIIITLMAVLAISGCTAANTPAQTTAEVQQTTTEAPKTTTEAPKTTTEAPKTTTAAISENTDIPDKHPIWNYEGKTFYFEDGKPGEQILFTTDNAVIRISSGICHDNVSDPGLFEPDEFLYSGEEAPLGETALVKAGDVIGGAVIASASTDFMPDTDWETDPPTPHYDKYDDYTAFYSIVRLKGNITLTGALVYSYDEDYAISSGDLFFLPDSSYKGLPCAVSISGSDSFGSRIFDSKGSSIEDTMEYTGGLCMYSDAPLFRVGNLFDGYYDVDSTQRISYDSSLGLDDILDGGNANCIKKVEITLSKVDLIWSDQFGTGHSTAKIEAVRAI